jgi:hypothetical protein
MVRLEWEILFGLLGCLRAFFHTGELMTPVTFKRASPFMQRLDGLGVRSVEHLATLPPDIHQTDFKQDAEVLGNGRLRQIEAGDDVVYRALLGYEKGENVAATGFGHGVKGVGGCGGARHERIIFLYRNMSRGILSYQLRTGSSREALAPAEFRCN